MDKKNKLKPRSLKPSVKRLIYTWAVKERKVPREFLANQLIKEIEESHEIPPTLETAMRYISAARNTKNPIDKPWSLGACRDYPQYFPPSSIPFLMEYLSVDVVYSEDYGDYHQKYKFTIRDAIWMVRLESVIEKYIPTDNDEFTIFAISGIYSSAELASETMGDEKFDSTELDSYLYNGDLDALLQYDPESKKKAKILYSNSAKGKEN